MRQVPELDTIEPMVVRSPLGWEALPTRAKRPWLTIVVPLCLILSTIIASYFISLPYFALAPGSARTVDDLVKIDGAPQRFPPDGEVLLTTVSLGEVRAIDAFFGWLDADVDIVPRDRILPPDTSGDEYREINRELMADSQKTAAVVALRRLGYQIAERGKGGLVARVVNGTPAEKRLRVGDVITAVDGQPTPLSQDVVAAIQARQPGDQVTLDVGRLNRDEQRTEQVVLGSSPTGAPGGFLGVEVRTAGREFDMPFEVRIDAGQIGGPSAGLAFALEIIDVLTQGELTGGQRVAVTGTISIDGTVGAVGGVGQKAAAVRDAGIKVFLVPAGEARVARARAGGSVQVIGVRTLEEALAALARVGGDTAALGAPPAGT